MLEKFKVFDAEHNHLPVKAAAAFLGFSLGFVIVSAVLSAMEEEEFEFNFDEESVEE